MLIVGAGGCAQDLVAMLELENDRPELVFYDDVNAERGDLLFGRYRILRSMRDATDYFRLGDNRFAVAIGNPSTRQRLQRQFESAGGVPTSLVSSRSTIGNYSRISGRGTIVMHNVTITNDVTIGEGALINMGCTLGHGAFVGEFSELCPAVYFSRSRVGARTQLGIGVIIVPGSNVGDDVVAGAGAVITRDVPSGVRVAGVPARW